MKIQGENHYLVAIDGTGHFSSEEVHCKNCLTRIHNKGKENESTTYQHQSLNAVLVHPSLKTVIPFAPEEIIRQDGSEKNDCELNSFKRLVLHFRESHPHLKIIFVLDALYAKGPVINQLRAAQIPFIIGVKPGDHPGLFQYIEGATERGNMCMYDWSEEFGDKIKKKRTSRCRSIQRAILNAQEDAPCVGFVEYWESVEWVDSKGKAQLEEIHFSWITDLPIRGPEQIKK